MEPFVRVPALLLVVVASIVMACDGPQYLNVDNQSETTYVAVSDDGHHLIIPPKRKIKVAVFPFAGVPETPAAPVQLFDSHCTSVGRFDEPGTITIPSDGTLSYRSEEPGPGDLAEDSAFCTPGQPLPTAASP